jgi:peptidyl-prolyl cis-trans isomerase C
MRIGLVSWLAVVVLCIAGNAAHGQGRAAAPGTPPATQNSASQIAASVNGQAIPEIAVQRGLRRVPPAMQSEARAQIIKFLIDNVLLDQYLIRLQVAVDPKDVDAKVKQVQDEMKKEGSTLDKIMQDLKLSDTELHSQITAQLRWEKYASDQATLQVLRDFFEKNPEMFDGTMVHARHILLTPPAGNSQADAAAKSQLLGFKKTIEEEVAGAMAKLPPQTDNLEREKARARLTEEAFVKLASRESACPSKAQGGDLGWFPRAGTMVEQFSKVAFALKLYQISDVVTTQFGHHLILVVERRPGKEPKFDEVKDDVKEVYSDRLRESLCAQLRPSASVRISVAPTP